MGEDATYIISGKVGAKNLKEFTSQQKKVGVVCGLLLEGYDNANVTLAVILRKCQSRVLFEQFVGRCVRMHRESAGRDKSKGVILTYDYYNQQPLWDVRDKVAVVDPENVPEEGELINTDDE